MELEKVIEVDSAEHRILPIEDILAKAIQGITIQWRWTVGDKIIQTEMVGGPDMAIHGFGIRINTQPVEVGEEMERVVVMDNRRHMTGGV